MYSVDGWQKILTACGCDSALAARWSPIFAAEIKFDTFSAGAAELPDFLGQILHESGMLKRLVENLNYSKADRIKAVWPTRFANVEDAKPFVNNPEALANKVYGDRMGNGTPGSGWRYRGRGILMVTGANNYSAVGRAIGIDLITNPDRLAEPSIALKAAIQWWEANIPDSAVGDVKKITRIVNGGETGLEDRLALQERAAKALEAV